jgi:hypothetical protein
MSSVFAVQLPDIYSEKKLSIAISDPQKIKEKELSFKFSFVLLITSLIS